MANNLEWAKVGPHSNSSPVFSAYGALAEDQEHRLLDPDYDYWNVALGVDDVVLYADSPQQLEKWLSDRLKETRDHIAELETKRAANTEWRVIVRQESGAERIAAVTGESPAEAAWSYLRQKEQGPETDLVQLVEVDEVSARVLLQSHDEDELEEPSGKTTAATPTEGPAETDTMEATPEIERLIEAVTARNAEKRIIVAAVKNGDKAAALGALDTARERLAKAYTQALTDPRPKGRGMPAEAVHDLFATARHALDAGAHQLASDRIETAVDERNADAAEGAYDYFVERIRTLYGAEVDRYTDTN